MNTLSKKLTAICPMCREKTLEAQSDVVWCTNLGGAGERPCQFGMGTGEKTLNDLNIAAI